jgi:hypothetical protein
MNTYEYFQNNNSESDLNSAYNNVSLNDSMHNVPFCNANNNAGPLATTSVTVTPDSIEKSTMSNLWDFLGLTNLSTEKKECLFDCTIHGARCLERCKFKDPEKCKYRCLKHGLYCSKKCVMTPDSIPDAKCINPTTQSGNNANANKANNNANNNSNQGNNHANNANQANKANNANANNANNANANQANNANANNHANNNTKKYPPLPIGNQHDYMGYAPFDSNLWPSHTQSGWDMEKLNKPDPSLFIEVLVPNQFIYPEETGKPSLLF